MFFRIPTSNSFYFFYDSDITYVYISLHILSLQFLNPQSTIQVSSQQLTVTNAYKLS